MMFGFDLVKVFLFLMVVALFTLFFWFFQRLKKAERALAELLSLGKEEEECKEVPKQEDKQ